MAPQRVSGDEAGAAEEARTGCRDDRLCRAKATTFREGDEVRRLGRVHFSGWHIRFPLLRVLPTATDSERLLLAHEQLRMEQRECDPVIRIQVFQGFFKLAFCDKAEELLCDHLCGGHL